MMGVVVVVVCVCVCHTRGVGSDVGDLVVHGSAAVGAGVAGHLRHRRGGSQGVRLSGPRCTTNFEQVHDVVKPTLWGGLEVLQEWWKGS
jgi:hypothetical protein